MAVREPARRREAERLDAEILDAIGRGWTDPVSDREFDHLARDIFAHQFRFNRVYQQFCALRDISAPSEVRAWFDIPPVPTGAFKVGRWATFPENREIVSFRTSGTTQGRPGAHRFETLALYNATIVASARRYLFTDGEPTPCLFLSPRPSEAPESSLVHMFAVFGEAFGAPGSGFFVRPAVGAGLSTEAFDAAIVLARDRGVPVVIAGAALAFQHVLDAAESGTWRVTPGSRTLITGGFKGARRAVDPVKMAERITGVFGIPAGLQVEEYGMTELSTQYYDDGFRAQTAGERARAGFRVPPWCRVRIVDPLTGDELPVGSEGVIIHYDLANRASAVAIQTSDVGRRTEDGGFVLTGRAPDAEARGCSLAAELWLERG